MHSILNTATWESSPDPSSFVNITHVFQPLSQDCRDVLKDEKLMQQLKAKNFDVIIIHLVDFCSFGMAHALGIEGIIWMSTAFAVDPMAWYAGMASPASYVVSAPYPATDRMPFTERVKNFLVTTTVHTLFQFGIVRVYNSIFHEQYGPTFPTFNELLYKTQLYFINSDPMFEYPRPVTPNVIYVGGLTMKNAEPLNEVKLILRRSSLLYANVMRVVL